MQTPKLYMVLLGATPKGRHIEQHDMFFGIGTSLADLVPQIEAFWPEAAGKIHIDGYREVTKVGEYKVEVVAKAAGRKQDPTSLFFLNLGGYKQGEFEEFHYKVLVVTDQKALAIQEAKESTFYKHTGFGEAPSHIDDRYGVDVDDVFDIKDILPESIRQQYQLKFSKAGQLPDDELWLGYMPLNRLP
ncbi:hypothetical protein D9M68_524390 [compost metagenome]